MRDDGWSRRMKFGIQPTEGGDFFRESLEEVIWAEEYGFDSVWLSEHHGVSEHYWATPLLALAGYAARTSKIAIASNVIVLPFYNPIRVAEESAFLDSMSGGRFILGVGMGYREDEFRAYGVDFKSKGARYEEGLQVLRAAFDTGRVDLNGRFHQIDGFVLEPRPKRRIPIWAGGWGAENVRRAAQYADVWLPGPVGDLPKVVDCQRQFEARRRELGLPIPDERPITRELVIAATDAQAREAAERYLLRNYKDEYAGGWNHPLFADGKVNPRDVGQVGANRFIIGSPDAVIRQVQAHVDALATNHVIFRVFAPGTPHDFIMRGIELLGKEVLPAFRGARTTA
jgi:alkanesulfonate monooxygenase SsuD/methylene tetrahydromethanopterin reductase-like flavin-dependent oxidoreductase (luciferase family)